MIFATICVSVLLFVLLGIINGVNFTMASQDADRLTKALKKQHGAFETTPEDEAGEPSEGFLPRRWNRPCGILRSPSIKRETRNA